MNSTEPLDNPVWSALTTQQSALAVGDDLARCYPRNIATFGGLADFSPTAYDQLAVVVGAGKTVALVGVTPPTNPGWTVIRQFFVVQMVYQGPALKPAPSATPITPLASADVPAMLDLVALTHPGPFMEHTIDLGLYLGIWQAGQLAAMAGERMHLSGYREISAVCTHPGFQRRGYARQLLLQLIPKIQSEGDVPFLHVVAENTSAQALYESLGFQRRATLPLYALRCP